MGCGAHPSSRAVRTPALSTALAKTDREGVPPCRGGPKGRGARPRGGLAMKPGVGREKAGPTLRRRTGFRSLRARRPLFPNQGGAVWAFAASLSRSVSDGGVRA